MVKLGCNSEDMVEVEDIVDYQRQVHILGNFDFDLDMADKEQILDCLHKDLEEYNLELVDISVGVDIVVDFDSHFGHYFHNFQVIKFIYIGFCWLNKLLAD